MFDLLGVVLAGGRSSRFGSDKFFHLHDGVEMGLRAVQCLSPLVDRVIVAGRTELPHAWDCLPLKGSREGSGPLGAILDAHEHHPARSVLVVPCDMPELTSRSLHRLVDALHAGSLDATFARSVDADEAQWLAGCWSGRALATDVSVAFDAGQRSVRDVARGLRHGFVDLPREELLNVNTVESS